MSFTVDSSSRGKVGRYIGLDKLLPQRCLRKHLTMKKNDILLFCVVMVNLVNLTFQARPVLTIPGKSSVVSLAEKADQQQVLVTNIACTDADADPTRVYVKSISPAHPCSSCFFLWPCGKGYCLNFVPGRGKLFYSSAPIYLVTVECSDGSLATSSFIEIRLVANEPPRFSSLYVSEKVTGTQSKRMGDEIYDAKASDTDKDSLYYTMTTDVASDFFGIVYGSGKVVALKDLRLLCEDSARLTITTSDTYHNPVGPMVVSLDLGGGNKRPVIKNTQIVVDMRENPQDAKSAGIGTDVLRLDIDDLSTYYTNFLVKLRAEPERGLEYYTLLVQKNIIKIQTRKRLNYEYAPLRTVKLYVDVSDGFCDATTYSVTVRIRDVNEEPVILPKEDIQRTVYEGFIQFDPGWRAYDPDENEKLEWRITSGGGEFGVNPSTGFIFSTGEYDVDKSKRQKEKILGVKVVDKKLQQDTAKLKLTILDKNDNAPKFFTSVYPVRATECTKLGALLGKLNAKDEDSEFQGNNRLVYSGTGSNITILSSGYVTLTGPCKVGQAETIQARVTDQGTYPGPLEGVPASVVFTCGPCPTQAVTTPATNDRRMRLRLRLLRNLTVAGLLDGEAGPAKSDFVTSNLAWIVPSAILGPLVLLLTPFFIWRFCWARCNRWCADRALRRKSLSRNPKAKKEKHNSNNAQEPKRQKKPAPPREDKRITPPEPPPPETDPCFYGFWKETYVDRDQRHMPQRDILPATVGQDRIVEEMEREEEEREKEETRQRRKKVEEEYQKELEMYRQKVEARNNAPPPTSPQPPPPPKKMRCNIL